MHPVVAEREDGRESVVGHSESEHRIKRAAKVVLLVRVGGKALFLVVLVQLRATPDIECLCQFREIRRMPSLEFLELFTVCQTLQCVLTDRLEHEEATTRKRLQQIEISERCERIDLRPGDTLGSVKGETAGEDCEAAKELLRGFVE